MTNKEKQRMLVGAIRKIEDRLIALRYCEYDGGKSLEERQEEQDTLQKHLHCAHSVLVQLIEEETEEAA